LQDICKIFTSFQQTVEASTPANAQRGANSNAAPVCARGGAPAALCDYADAEQFIGLRPRNVNHLPAVS
jgi:hypothetical protein